MKTHTGREADKMHDLLNLYSGLYDMHDHGDGRGLRAHVRCPGTADAVAAEAAGVLGVTEEQAHLVLQGAAGHRTAHVDDAEPAKGMTFEYDEGLLPQ
jgi:hypothetical protein